MNVYGKNTMSNLVKVLYTLIILYCLASPVAHGAGCNLIGGGKWWKGLSNTGVSVRVNSIRWYGATTGTGRYDVSLSVTMNQGVKNYYSSVTGDSWIRENLPSGVLQGEQQGCLEGNVVTATVDTLSVGGGTVSPKISNVIGYIGSNSAQILNNSANLPTIATIYTPSGEYMIGGSGSSYSDVWNGSVYISTNGVADGTYNIQLPMYISGVSVWFMSGSNYWDRVNGQNVAPPVMPVNLPLTIRISSGKPVNPDISCNVSSAVNIEHGTLKQTAVKTNEKKSDVKITCNAATSGSIELKGSDNNINYALVNLGGNIKSELSVSTNQSNWTRVLNDFHLQSGVNNLYLRSRLLAENSIESGSFRGSAVAVVTIH